MRIFQPTITGSAVITGNLEVAQGITGSLFGTSSWAITASYAMNGGTGGSTNTGSLLVTASVATNVITFTKGDASQFSITVATGSVTPAAFPYTGSAEISGSLTVTGLVTATLGFTGSLFGTSSWTQNAVTASYVLSSVSSSFSATASYVNPLSQNVIVNGFVTASAILVSGSGGNINRLLVIGSGSNIPLFTVQGSQGELFSITDSLSGSLFSVNDISGLPIIEAFSDGIITLGSTLAPSLYTTVKTSSIAGSNLIYSVPTSSYDGIWFEYVVKSGSNARAGQLMSVWGGTSVNFTETTTTDIGNTTGVNFTSILSGANLLITGSTTTANWTIKGIIRSI